VFIGIASDPVVFRAPRPLASPEGATHTP